MLRVLILTVVVLAIFVFVRLVFLRLTMTNRKLEPEAPTIDAQITYSRKLEIRKITFKNFDFTKGPTAADDFYEQALVQVGPEGMSESRILTLQVATPKALTSAVRSGARFERNLLVVERYDPAEIRRLVQKHLTELEG